MEHGRLLIAIFLSFLVFFTWEFFFVDRGEVEKKKQPQESTQVENAKGHEKMITEVSPYVEETPPQIEETPHPAVTTYGKVESVLQQAKTLTIDTPYYAVIISEKGGAIKSLELKEYREDVKKDSPWKELVSPELPTGTVLTGFNGIVGMKEAIFAKDRDTDRLKVFNQSETVIFTWVAPNGVVIEKKYLFSPETYIIGLSVTIRNGSAASVQGTLALSLLKQFSENGGRTYGFEGPSALINDDLQQIKIKNIEEEGTHDGTFKWICVQDRYFLSCIIPEHPVDGTMRLFSN